MTPPHAHTDEWLPARNVRERKSYGRLSFSASFCGDWGKDHEHRKVIQWRAHEQAC